MMAKPRLSTVSLAGCFGCHMSLLDTDERFLDLLQRVDLDRTPLSDVKTLGHCDIGFIEGGVCNAENVRWLREYRERCKLIIAVGACAINGGLPAQRNHLSVAEVLTGVYRARPGLARAEVPSDADLPLPLDKVYPLHEIVHVDVSVPGCPPSADAIWTVLTDLIDGRSPRLSGALLRYD